MNELFNDIARTEYIIDECGLKIPSMLVIYNGKKEQHG